MNDSTLSLGWNEPLESGGRTDLSYSVRCTVCRAAGTPCLSCGDSVSYRPAQHGLVERRVEVWGLLPQATYIFTIQALNGVSQLSGKEAASESVNITTTHDGKEERGCPFFSECPVVLMSVVLSSAVAGVSDSEDRLHREQPDPALVGPRSPTLHHPALPDPLLREGQNPREHILAFSCPAAMSTLVDSSWLEGSQEKKCKHRERLRG